MKVETETIKNEVFTNEEGTNRYLLQRRWGESNTAIVAVITLKPVSVNPLHNDLTTMLIQNHVADMGYKGFIALNLVSGISMSNKVSETLSDREIENELLKEALNKKEVQQVIVACGSSVSKKGYPQERLKEILNLLTKTNKEKVVVIVDDEDKPIHPLVPSIRNQPWILKKIKL
ncbi:DUF1643 domain-containing protein [Vagococcus fluvialis]|uniref:DUF1643 domain-containing protein n=1 Tax=Vagococcus fluvialis TaxID=2738 RepID=UPI00288FB401|nr:DUF1643 domain-containing protein [Vagococcus fluvialis]MDT2782351.1 DUF1643 domain-containing protein [Vagococcus fluvialis]